MLIFKFFMTSVYVTKAASGSEILSPPRIVLAGPGLSVFSLYRPFPKGTVPFGSAPKPIMCPLVPPQNQHIFNSHLNYLNYLNFGSKYRA